MKVFRTSIDWSRIFPDGDNETPNHQGIQFYIDLFDQCHKRGMKVFATILHYNIPLNLVTEYGGWKNRKLVDFYLKFVRVLFDSEIGLISGYRSMRLMPGSLTPITVCA
ncbi:TPA: glycoside hydrolase family 1 protein [Klebsiella pneumoniae]|nr:MULTISPECIES: family 1 glycosylhydrolase [Klebsiella]SSI81199.1 6-phospho-beta-glucosidase [Klebsiella pneumoniae]SVJ71101.1 6-phospho-beta-glucosidase [Klebsiella pneumoniae]SYG07853.1 6-phospho-beta-glucosidase [Klebsiella pneumoniae]GKO89230.1 hypothetical protein NUBL21983_48060 [Klebsiella variicola]HBR2229144.1 glycoside hydrolase family 1 protein [Klebsiella pneumoniae]